MVATDAWVKTALDEPDHPQGWDTSNWTARDYEPRGDVPIVHDWEVLCGQCGELVFLKLTEAAAEAYSRLLVRRHQRCERCHGWLSMARSYTTPRAFVQGIPMAGDKLEGPKYQGQKIRAAA